MQVKKIGFIILLECLVLSGAFAQSPADIIKELDRRQTFKSLQVEGSITISHRLLGDRTSNFIMYSQGEYDTLLEFKSGAERGQKVLRTRDRVYLYSPNSEDIILLQGSALQQSIMGSGGDLSYEDMTATNDTISVYDLEQQPDEEIDAVSYWRIKLSVKRSKRRTVAYPQQILWIEKDNYYLKKAQYFSGTGTLIKEMFVNELIQQGSFFIIADMTIKDLLKNNGSTNVKMSNIELNPDLPQNKFSLDELSF